MEISNSGRIVIIDDEHNEAFPLMEMLGKEGLPYMYYDGQPNGLPEKPPGGVRFVFLDIELQGMKGQDDKTKASGLIGRLKKIISKQNGPYMFYIFQLCHRRQNMILWDPRCFLSNGTSCLIFSQRQQITLTDWEIFNYKWMFIRQL